MFGNMLQIEQIQDLLRIEQGMRTILNQAIGSTALRGKYIPGHRKDFTALFSSKIYRDQRATLDAGFYHHRRQR